MVDVGETKLTSGINLKQALDIINKANIKMNSLENILNVNLKQFESTNARFSAVEQLMLDTNLNSMKGEFDNIKRNIEVLKQEIKDGIKNQQETFYNKINEIENKEQKLLDTLEEYKKTVINSLESTNQKQSAIEEKINNQPKYDEKFTQLDLKINNLTEKLSSFELLEEKITKLKEELTDKSDLYQKFGSLEESINAMLETQKVLKDKISNIKSSESLENEIASLKNRILNLETIEDITTGEEIGVSLDSFSILKKVIENNLGKEKMENLIQDEKVDDPSIVVDLMKKVFLEYVYWDELSKSPNSVEILLKYSQMGISDKTSIIIAFAKDVRKLLEAGQTVLAAIGIEKSRTRNVMEEAKNIVRKWTSDSDVDSKEIGAAKIIELLDTLILVYKQ